MEAGGVATNSSDPPATMKKWNSRNASRSALGKVALHIAAAPKHRRTEDLTCIDLRKAQVQPWDAARFDP